MIPRTLVPRDVRPASPDDMKRNGHRRTTYMDDRTVVPSELSDAPPLDGKTKIPMHMVLEVLTMRSLVDRAMPVKPLERPENFSEYSIPIAVQDTRVVVPAYVEPPAQEIQKETLRAPEMTPELREVVEPDIFITGDANLLVQPKAKQSASHDAAVRTVSIIIHVAVILLLIFPPAFLQRRAPTQADLDLARKELSFVYMPPEGPAAPKPPVPRVHIDRRTLNKITPPVEAPVLPPQPAPKAEAPRPEPPKELPDAPKPQLPPPPLAVQPDPEATKPSELQPITPPKPNPNSHLNLGLDDSSPTKMLHDEIADAAHQNSGRVYVPQSGGISRPGGGGQGPGMQPGVSMLTPTEGVDFSSYLQRVLASVKRNWYAVMPESAWMGDRGVVVLTFKIKRDGIVPQPDPLLERTSGKNPLDVAAMSSIRASSPFEPLPPEFKGPYIELRFIFFYNIPPNLTQ